MNAAPCRHQPSCPSPENPGRAAAVDVRAHPEQGWSLLCNGVVVFEDGGCLLPGECSAIFGQQL